MRQAPYPLVVKADGLCGGNGVFVCDDEAETLKAVDRLMVDRIFGASGERIVLERRLQGRELSFFALLDGESYLLLPMALDYPKSDDGNRGVISGGMGAFCPHPLEDEALMANVEKRILHPLMRMIAEEGIRYTGPIYLGCMFDAGEPYLLEINARMGDPEAEVVLPRIENDFPALCRAILDKSLGRHSLRLNDLFFCDVVATQGPTRKDGEGAKSYPGWPFGDFGRGYPVTGLDAVDTSRCRLYVGEATARPDGTLVSDGGRVVHVVGVGSTLDAAVEHAYGNVSRISFEGIRYRRDVGKCLPWEDSTEESGTGA